METNHFLWIALGFILLTLLCLGAIVWALMTLSRSFKSAAHFLRIVGLWLLLISGTALTGFTQNFSVFPLNALIILLPPMIALIVLVFNQRFKQFLGGVPLRWLTGIQFFRVIVEIFLWQLYEIGLIPVQMTFEGQNFDILAGLTAPIFAYFYGNKPRVLFWWNIAGMLLLINIVGTAILSMPTPIRVFMNEPANTIVTYFPIIWLPAFLVPLAYYMHILSLKKILQ
ncbi:MAG: hypothetical protein HC880_16540 [Bacteroidia bacterium]|nr:hypothetical protein [Bacteroidia bacterium]